MHAWRLDPAANGPVLLRDRAETGIRGIQAELHPAFVKEFINFGLDKAVKLPDTELPVAWYSNGIYYYRGQKFARRRGEKIELTRNPTANGEPLQPFRPDISKSLSSEGLFELEAITRASFEQKLADAKISRFNVAYSAGKDSEALLLFCLRNLKDRIAKVVFADTTLEFTATIEHAERVKARLAREGVAMSIERPSIDAETGWRLFGVPSRNARWCCTALKSGAMHKLAGHGEAIALGVRSCESTLRAEYSDEAKANRQLNAGITFRPIYDWNTAEVWLYLYAFGAEINPIYREGYHRACCIVCPYARPIEARLAARIEPERVERFRAEYMRQYPNERPQNFFERYPEHGKRGAGLSWSRCHAECLKGPFPSREQICDGVRLYTHPENANLAPWLQLARRNFTIREHETERGRVIEYLTIKRTHENVQVTNLLDHAHYCIACGYCLNYCITGALSIDEGRITLDDAKCSNCLRCAEQKCLRQKSLVNFKPENYIL